MLDLYLHLFKLRQNDSKMRLESLVVNIDLSLLVWTWLSLSLHLFSLMSILNLQIINDELHIIKTFIFKLN